MYYSQIGTTEILATMGPSLCEEKHILQASSLGVTNFRVHMGVRKEHCFQYFQNVRTVESRINKHFDILLDLPTKKPRVGRMNNIKPIIDQEYIFSPQESSESDNIIPLKGLRELNGELAPGQRINFSDGKVIFCITEVLGNEIKAVCTKSASYIYSELSSCVFPDSDVFFDLFFDSDLELMKKLKQNNLCPDWVAISFADDCSRINQVKDVIRSLWTDKVRFMAKIETAKGWKEFHQILDCVDGTMVARGDLLSFIEPYMLPYIQKELVRLTRQAEKTTVVATEMLERFADTGVVSRPELTDIATAVRQGASAVMLSVESSNCSRAFECMELMGKIIEFEEKHNNGGE